MIMKYITEDILNFYHVNFLSAYFAEKKVENHCFSVLLLLYYNTLAYFCREPNF